ncbi:vacuolar protein sorting-associated protein 51 homolog [Eurytemora carolleeae]|uniref:vacuolar protein sorting-associated protein 51 homolog n=1 Tax=Eurytemora carolleeae TaxID=1294199 RepID=UPI000C760C35|nr:vacuolar protein sorting-associated protein 51 homolog [Eurytemora carolleeae]|eukprot:XP_023319685.1 vacuolar protein sorting-associated protein 51 homolog [Eurytemora affinis]
MREEDEKSRRGGEGEGSKNRTKLSKFYGLSSDNSSVESEGKMNMNVRRPSQHMRKLHTPIQTNPLDINGPGFDPDLFVNKLVKEASLSQLMNQEKEIVSQIKGLDSDMQTLVYENYNKFIAATETIRKMRVDFKSMEEEMDQLAGSMSSITNFSSQISDKLRTRRQDVAQLSATHTTLQKLQFVLELPDKLKECLKEEQYRKAVQYWVKASAALEHYRDMPSFSGIQEDCEEIVALMNHDLQLRLKNPECTGEQLSEAVQLLQQLGSPADSLVDSYLAHEAVKLTSSLAELENQITMITNPELSKVSESVVVMDCLEFVDHASNIFLAELSSTISAFNAVFTDYPEGSNQQLMSWIQEYLDQYMDLVQRRLSLEKEEGETVILVRAIDRFYKKLLAAGRTIPGLNLGTAALDVVLNITSSFVNSIARGLENSLQENLLAVRQVIAAPRRNGGESPTPPLSELANSLLSGIVDSIKSALKGLKRFLDPELAYSVKPGFRSRFSKELVLHSVLFNQFWFTRDACNKFTGDVSVPPGLLLLLSRTCLDLHLSTVSYLSSYTQDEFLIADLPNISPVSLALATTAQNLLDRYVQVESGDLSLLLRKSVEARDWLSTVEPRSVRAVMKRIVEDVTLIDTQVGQLYEDGQKKARSSDSSRRTGARSRSVFSSYGTGRNMESSLATNIQKLFSERIDFFTAVRPAKISVLTCIIKLGLKTLLECVRLKTFARFGLQQIQVDCHYLQLYLWRFVEDEAVVYHLLDEIMSSALLRSLEQPPILMEPSIVEVICDKV